MEVSYEGPARGAYLLAGELEKAGAHGVEYPRPFEKRGVGEEVVHVTMTIGEWAGSDVGIRDAAIEEVRHAVGNFLVRHPEARAEVDDFA